MYGMEKVTVKMSDIVKKMGNHVPESFLRHYILLATVLTITAFYYCTTVQAILFFSLWYMRQGNFFLKILLRQYKEDNFRYFFDLFIFRTWLRSTGKYKKYKNPFFFVTEQLR